MGGTVIGGEGAPVGGASLTVEHATSGLSRSLRAAQDGRFEFSLLPPGAYALHVEQFGFRPLLIEGIVIRPGQRVEVPVTLVAVSQAADQVDSVVFRGALLAGTGPGLSVDLPDPLRRTYPDERRELLELGRLSSLSSAELEMQGLPASMSGIRVDGAPVGAIESAALLPGSLRGAALPLGMFESASLVASNPDVEWAGHAGGTLDAFTARGGRERGIRAFGSWSGEPLRTGASGPAADLGQTVYGGFQFGGPLIPDTANLVLGVEAWRLPSATFLPGIFGPAGEQALQVARNAHGVDPLADPASSDVVSAYGHLAWQVAPSTHLDTRASFALISAGGGDLRSPPALASGRPFDGRDLFVGATLTTWFSDRVYQEVRLGFDATSRTYEETDGFGLSGATRILSSGVVFGPEGYRPRTFDGSTFRASETLHFLRGDHRWKVGLVATLASAEVGRTAATEIFFADPADFATGEGFAVHTEPTAGRADFSTPQASLFVQDTWAAGTGLEVLLGLRADLEKLPAGEVESNDAWQTLSGLDNTDVGDLWGRLSPRAGFTWDLQDRHEWVITGSAGLFSGTTDPVLLSDWAAGDEGILVRRGFGSLGDWPAGPVDPSGQAASLTLLAPDFEAPRTLRANLGISRRLGAQTALRLSGLYRYTDFLPRHSDLNLLPGANAEDQFGRAVYGDLRQRGGLLYAEPGSNRRFAGFDQVTAISVDGWSTYRALTASLEHRQGDGIDLFASYTYSQTEDNWNPGSGVAGSTFAPLSDAAGDDWMEGRSDLDVPHRAVAGVELRSDLLAGLRSGVVYRYRSGHPFTPGFRDGVDANADGAFRNDPAFVDRAVPGVESLLGAWSCLQDQVGGFADRNSCRTDGVHSLDARFALGLARLGRYSAELVVDGLNLLSTEQEYPDAALYLVDPAGSVTLDPTTGRVSVPLLANENFGQPIGTFQPGRVLRLGFRLSH